jgi:hypothetical protein
MQTREQTHNGLLMNAHRIHEIHENEPAPNRGPDCEKGRGECRPRGSGMEQARIRDAEGNPIQPEHASPEPRRFDTRKGISYSLAFNETKT